MAQFKDRLKVLHIPTTFIPYKLANTKNLAKKCQVQSYSPAEKSSEKSEIVLPTGNFCQKCHLATQSRQNNMGEAELTFKQRWGRKFTCSNKCKPLLHKEELILLLFINQNVSCIAPLGHSSLKFKLRASAHSGVSNFHI